MNFFYSRTALLFYLLEFFLWGFFSIGILLGIDVRVPLGHFAFNLVPIYGLFILFSAAIHLIALLKSWHSLARTILILNGVGIFGYIVFVFVALNKAMYR